MHRFSKLPVALGALIVSAGCGTAPMGPTGEPAAEVAPPSYQLQQRNMVNYGMMLNTPEFRQISYVFREVNAMRAAAGLPALTPDSNLMRAAARHSRDMATRNYSAHNSPEGTTPDARMRAAGASFNWWAENIGLQSPPDLTAGSRMMHFWRNSDDHRKNILNPQFKRSGIYAYRRPSDGFWYYTQVFSD